MTLGSRTRTHRWAIARTLIAAGLIASNPLGAQSIAVNAGIAVSARVLPGSKITVPVNVDITNAGAASIASLATGMTWNPNRLQLDSIRPLPELEWAFSSNTTDKLTGSSSFNTSNATPLLRQ